MQIYQLTKSVLLLTFILILSACGSLQPKTAFQPNVTITMEAQDRIRFSGKGAGAGMMMSSSMGAMGIAIGVAIDEGIGKDIHTAFESAGGHFSNMVKSQTEAKLLELCGQPSGLSVCGGDSPLEIKIHHYGFILAPGENDPIKPELDISFISNEQETRLDLKKADLSPLYIFLDDAKQNGEGSVSALNAAYVMLLDQDTDTITK